MLIPEVKQINGIWMGNVTLDLWNAFFGKESDIDLNVGGDKLIECLDTRHKVAYEYLVTNQNKLLEIILSALLVEYPTMQEEYGYEDEELNEYMPNVDNIQEFKEIMEPKRIYILDIEKDWMAYLGFHFKCTWDEEHDYGILIHKERVVKMGGADVAFLSWIAEEDKKAI
ncbi:DUF6985 domain-containing protein [Anaerosporobacter sp.]